MLSVKDAAQGFGGRIGTKEACSFGDIATTSFFPAKPLGCYRDGGAIFTDNDEWAGLIRSFRIHGKGEDKYDNVRIGMNSRLDTMQAALKEQGIPSMIYYPKAMHEQGAFREIEGVVTDLSVTTELCKRVLALPMHPYLDEAEQGKVIAAVKGYLGM